MNWTRIHAASGSLDFIKFALVPKHGFSTAEVTIE